MRKIHYLLNEPGTISLGYNTLGFDDEFLRFSFFRNLLNPYTHQYANGCSRMDLFPMAVMYYLYKNHVLTWPDIDGKNSLKLEYLSEENNLATGMAHDAMVDVMATVELAKRFKQDKQMWEYLSGFFDKNIDRKRLQSLPIEFEAGSKKYAFGLYHEGKIGAECNYISPVLCIGGDNFSSGKNSLWLRLDQSELLAISRDKITENSWVIKKTIGVPGFILPAKNHYIKYINEERADIVQANLSMLKESPEIIEMINTYETNFEYPKIENLDPDATLYSKGFTSDQDYRIFEVFHSSLVEEKEKIALQIKDPIMKRLAFRVLCRNFSEVVSVGIRTKFHDFLGKLKYEEHNDVIDFREEKHISVEGVINEIEDLKENEILKDEQTSLLEELSEYCRSFGQN